MMAEMIIGLGLCVSCWMLGFYRGIRKAANICQHSVEAYDDGAGSSHSDEARKIGKAQAEWCRDEILTARMFK